MISKIRDFFKELKQEVHRSNFLSQMNSKDITYMRDQLNKATETNCSYFKNFESSIAAIAKTVSSIELEMLMSRGACLDNNFEGKQDL